MASASTSYVNVNIWLAKDKDGFTTNSFDGAAKHKEPSPSLARCGHTSLSIYSEDRDIVYVSLWPSHGGTSTLVSSYESDQLLEGSLPDCIIRLNNLNVPEMITVFNEVKTKKIRWTLSVSDRRDVTEPSNREASCSSFAWTILKAGGLDINVRASNLYQQHVSARGPRDLNFYNLTKCNAGDLLRGIFNGAPWTYTNFTPKALLLRVASAAEAYSKDKSETSAIMQSDQVAKEKEKSPSDADKGSLDKKNSK